MVNNYSNSRVLLTLFVIIILGGYFYPSSAEAVTITPTRFEVSGNPGETLNEEILLINETEDAETFYPSYANFEAQGESGDPAFVEPRSGLGTWIRTEEQAITLLPNQQRIVPFTITIPENAEPGGHFAVVFWGTSSGNSGSVSVGAKTGILVLLSVKGKVEEDAGLLNFNTVGNKFWYSTLPVSFEYRFKNDGGDRIKPRGKIAIRDTIFIPAKNLNANPTEGNILPASTRKFKVDWLEFQYPEDYVAPTEFFKKFLSDVNYQWKNFAVGLYSARLDVAYGTEGVHAKSMVFFFVFPWQLVLVMLIVGFIVILIGGKIIGRYNRFIINKARMEGR